MSLPEHMARLLAELESGPGAARSPAAWCEGPCLDAGARAIFSFPVQLGQARLGALDF